MMPNLVTIYTKTKETGLPSSSSQCSLGGKKPGEHKLPYWHEQGRKPTCTDKIIGVHEKRDP